MTLVKFQAGRAVDPRSFMGPYVNEAGVRRASLLPQQRPPVTQEERTVFGRKKQTPAGGDSARAAGDPPLKFPEDEDPTLTDWSDLDTIRAEWPQAKFDDDDRLGYDNGIRLSGDPSMPPAQRSNFAEYITRGLRHALYNDGLLSDEEIRTGATTILGLLDSAPQPDSKISLYIQRLSIRLALAVVKMNGWQPEALGGDGSVSISPTSPVVVDAIRFRGVDDSVAIGRFFGAN